MCGPSHCTRRWTGGNLPAAAASKAEASRTPQLREGSPKRASTNVNAPGPVRLRTQATFRKSALRAAPRTVPVSCGPWTPAAPPPSPRRAAPGRADEAAHPAPQRRGRAGGGRPDAGGAPRQPRHPARARARRPRDVPAHGAREPRPAPAVDLSARAPRPVRRPRRARDARGLRLPGRLPGRGRRPRGHLHDLPDRARLLPVRLPRLLRGRAPRGQGPHARGHGARPGLRVRHARAAPARGATSSRATRRPSPSPGARASGWRGSRRATC